MGNVLIKNKNRFDIHKDKDLILQCTKIQLFIFNIKGNLSFLIKLACVNECTMPSVTPNLQCC